MRELIAKRIAVKYAAIYSYIYRRIFTRGNLMCPEECLSYCFERLPQGISYFERTNRNFEQRRFDHYLFNVFLKNRVKDYIDFKYRRFRKDNKKNIQYKKLMENPTLIDQKYKDMIIEYLEGNSNQISIAKKYKYSKALLSKLLKKIDGV